MVFKAMQKRLALYQKMFMLLCSCTPIEQNKHYVFKAYGIRRRHFRQLIKDLQARVADAAEAHHRSLHCRSGSKTEKQNRQSISQMQQFYPERSGYRIKQMEGFDQENLHKSELRIQTFFSA